MIDRLSHTYTARPMRGHRSYLEIPRGYRRTLPPPRSVATMANAVATHTSGVGAAAGLPDEVREELDGALNTASKAISRAAKVED